LGLEYSELKQKNAQAVCACGDPISEHTDEGFHYCKRWNGGCTRFTTPEEMEALKRAHGIQ
jgi:hypothetical protein